MSEETQADPPGSLLSRRQTVHALRHFIIMGVLWAIYGPNAVVSGPVLSGFALKMGLTQAQIGFLVSFVGLFGLWQLVSSHLTRHRRGKRRLCVTLGLIEITAGSLVISTALVPEGMRFYAMAGLLSMAYLMGHTVNPIFNSWLSNVLPSEIRGSYTGRRLMYVSVTSIVYLYAASRWLDWQPELPGFMAVFAVGWVAGIAGYVVMGLTPYPRVTLEEPQGLTGALTGPLRDRGYRSLTIFMCTWLTACMMSGAFYSVYMLQDLDLSYAQVAIYTNITQFLMMVSYPLWGIAVQRFGSKPVTQISIWPYTVALGTWVWVNPVTYAWLIPIQRAVAGICWSGIQTANSTLLYKLVPSGKENTSYFANWMTFVAVAAAGGPFIGGVLREMLPEAGVEVFGMGFAPLQVVFALSSLLCLIPAVLSGWLLEAEATSPAYLLGQFRGNLLGYAYHYALYHMGLNEERRAEAARGMGRSRTPLAVEKLVDALDDVSPQVRSEAARGLGDTGQPEAVEPLVETLHDDESDIRPEAAEALGKIGTTGSVEALTRALRDEDPRLRVSAALALGEIGGEEARHALYERITGHFEKVTFAALIDGASRLGDLRIIEPALEHLPGFRSPVLRMQIINGVCRVLGEPRHFYRLLMSDALTRAAMYSTMTDRIVRLMNRSALTAEVRIPMERLARLFNQDLAGDHYAAAAEHARKIAVIACAQDALPEMPCAAGRAIVGYLDRARPEMLSDEGMIFTVVCLTSLARYLPT